MKTLKILLIVLASGVVMACSNPVRTEFDHHADLADYRTFAWRFPERSEVRDPTLDSELLDKRMRVALTRRLEDQGYRYDEENPDFFVTCHTASKEMMQACNRLRMAQYHYRRDGSLIVTPLTPGDRHYYGTTVENDASLSRACSEATLILDIINGRSDALVWRGWEKRRLAGKRLGTKAVRKAVEEILSEFPMAS